jgi:aliphatic nitrilase
MGAVFKVAAVQAAPEFMDLDACVDKGISLIREAAAKGASIIAFPECWIPGYPWWIWLAPPAHNLKYFQRYHENCLVVDSGAFSRLADAARENAIHVSMGASERDHGSLYIAQFLFDPAGDLVQARRKLKPTHVERTVFGEGDGSDLDVMDTAIGRVGQLCCWEHLQPLSKYALYSMHEQLHVAAWPSFSCYPQAYSLGPQANNAASQVYALEGSCFVLAPCGVISPEMIELMVETDDQAELLLPGGGHAQIYAPDGSPLCETLGEQEEGILYADIDLGAIAVAKSFADPVGHYARPDVTRLLLNRAARSPVEDGSRESWRDVEAGAPAGEPGEEALSRLFPGQ